jgi:hypothetical protein
LELARLLKSWQPRRTRPWLVFFVNAEPSYYRTDMGSWRYAKQLSKRGERVLGMIALETIGAFSDAPDRVISFAVPFERAKLSSTACNAHQGLYEVIRREVRVCPDFVDISSWLGRPHMAAG